MHWAMYDGVRRVAGPGARAVCPCCQNEVLAKCGEIIRWHWAHRANDCDTWHEPESEWHLSWKRKFPNEWQEVVIGCHRADVKTPKLVVELQASSLSAGEIRERERHYGSMVWLLRGHSFDSNLDVRLTASSGFFTFRWKWPRKSWWYATAPIVIDLLGHLLHVKKLYPDTPCGGWGYRITEEQFMQRCGVMRCLRERAGSER